ncbi:cytochrome b [Photobacterium gaetbulicola]|uniref:Putative cytochrome B561 n=1 Tax=Photobacterium gaetbulicola Gung47 TaxID=658445 RepID=A0A0C5WS22_9GAMM|nr:cytochrome b [Photobacterium gaetbulicola]AJR09162.1 putative cytochrome B561 [Photobacterium gaetbulicola Gung47]PSU11785.1 cytochrome b [Photobacterium gaetbulicola]
MDKTHFNPASIFLHWLTFCVLVAIYVSIEVAINFERGSATRDIFSQLHFYLGITLLVITLFRLLMRALSHKPAISPEPTPLQNKISGLVHICIYALMLLVPIAGLALLNSAGKTLSIMGMELPPLIDTNRALTATLRERHAQLGGGLLALITAHSAAALFHHYVIKDNTIIRMLPHAKKHIGPAKG